VLIYYPDNAEGNAATFNFDGPKHETGAAARRRIELAEATATKEAHTNA
jgi:hypothetical protein